MLEHEGPLPAEHSFIAVAPDNVVLTAVKKAEDGDGLILHLYEWAGKPTQVKIALPSGAASAELTDLMERPSGKALPVDAGSVTVPVGPYAIEALRVNYPEKGSGTR